MRDAKLRKRGRNGGTEGVIPPFGCSVGFRQVPRGSARFRSDPFWKIPHRSPHTSRPPIITWRFETSETLGVGELGDLEMDEGN